MFPKNLRKSIDSGRQAGNCEGIGGHVVASPCAAVCLLCIQGAFTLCRDQHARSVSNSAGGTPKSDLSAKWRCGKSAQNIWLGNISRHSQVRPAAHTDRVAHTTVVPRTDGVADTNGVNRTPDV
jgi:hypothetical protein